MKALSVKLPWAFAIAWLGKTVENRSRRHSHRGPFWVHATRCTYLDFADDMEAIGQAVQDQLLLDPDCPEAQAAAERLVLFNRASRYDMHTQWQAMHAAMMGRIVARADLTHVSDPVAVTANPWRDPSQFGWCLDHIQPIQPSAPMRGALGFWQPPTGTRGIITTNCPLITPARPS